MYNYVIVLGVSLLGLVLNQCNDSHYLEYHTCNILKQMWTILPKFAVPFNQLARYMQMYFLIRACEKSYIDKHIKLLTRIAVLFVVTQPLQHFVVLWFFNIDLTKTQLIDSTF